jgi:SH3-like domain-containing protein
MKYKMKKSQHFIAATLVFTLALSFLMNASATPLYAQSVNGTLVDIGQGDSRILTTDWQTIGPGQTVTYQFAYDGGSQPISISMNTAPAGSANFQVWTTDRLNQLKTDSTTPPLGQGTSPTSDTSVATWQGGSPIAEPSFVVVNPTGNITATYLLNISSLGLSAQQPGAVASTPTTTITTTTPTDPNIAVVTTDALNVRSGPSTAFPVLTTIPNGTEMTVLGRNPANTWLNVRLADGTEGWVTRSLTSYTLVSPNVITPAALPGAAATIAATLAATGTTPLTSTTPITGVSPVTATNSLSVTELGDNWHVLTPGQTVWYSFQYRGGNLPLTIWLDLDPFDQAQFTVVTAETFQAIENGAAPSPLPVVASGISNPVQPGYLFWQATFPEADTYYVMVAPTTAAAGDVLYSINALGPGVARAIQPTP